jgi:hypothetical protein
VDIECHRDKATSYEAAVSLIRCYQEESGSNVVTSRVKKLKKKKYKKKRFSVVTS